MLSTKIINVHTLCRIGGCYHRRTNKLFYTTDKETLKKCPPCTYKNNLTLLKNDLLRYTEQYIIKVVVKNTETNSIYNFPKLTSYKSIDEFMDLLLSLLKKEYHTFTVTTEYTLRFNSKAYKPSDELKQLQQALNKEIVKANGKPFKKQPSKDCKKKNKTLLNNLDDIVDNWYDQLETGQLNLDKQAANMISGLLDEVTCGLMNALCNQEPEKEEPKSQLHKEIIEANGKPKKKTPLIDQIGNSVENWGKKMEAMNQKPFEEQLENMLGTLLSGLAYDVCNSKKETPNNHVDSAYGGLFTPSNKQLDDILSNVKATKSYAQELGNMLDNSYMEELVHKMADKCQNNLHILEPEINPTNDQVGDMLDELLEELENGFYNSKTTKENPLYQPKNDFKLPMGAKVQEKAPTPWNIPSRKQEPVKTTNPFLRACQEQQERNKQKTVASPWINSNIEPDTYKKQDYMGEQITFDQVKHYKLEQERKQQKLEQAKKQEQEDFIKLLKQEQQKFEQAKKQEQEDFIKSLKQEQQKLEQERKQAQEDQYSRFLYNTLNSNQPTASPFLFRLPNQW